ncbi:MAG: hypothetical protein ACLSFR_01380 [Alphaproteobacteria bacterium]
MVKNTEPEVVAKPKKNQLKKAFYKLLFLVAVAGAAYVLWKNPQLTQKNPRGVEFQQYGGSHQRP